MTIQAERIAGYEDLDDTKYCYFKAGNFWYLYIPGCGLGSLEDHQVTEHEDGTITVSPSILVTGHARGGPFQRHGFLERGIWRDA
jgi:hypothetical protein